MVNRRKVDKSTRKLTKVGGHSIAVTIPIELIRELGWRERQKVTVKKRGNGLLITDWGGRCIDATGFGILKSCRN